jgi:uncharacterized membrane protein YbaN (DUF454 family)
VTGAPPPDDRSPSGPLPPHRWAYVALGWVFFGIGIVGLALPLVPTTPFMLLALWAFSRGSARFHHWLYHHRIFGPPLQRFRRDRVIPLWVKAVALGSMTASVLLVGLALRPPWYGTAAMAAVVLGGALYLARFPSRRAPE